ncbi:sugar transferase [Salinibacterium sp. ZJ450]|uniref:sugar transferase n=1 Tax=Salinibacterium sp. ZJ450 TaxID=2708338 RepID=UPI001CD3CACC|nr:sugar transferase [Salinibacterium sp. ZJ450]
MTGVDQPAHAGGVGFGPVGRSTASARRAGTASAHRASTASAHSVSPDGPSLGSGVWARRYRSKLLATDVAVILTTTLAFTVLMGPAIPDTAAGASRWWLITGLIALVWFGAMGALRSREWRVVGVGPTEYHRVVAATGLAFGVVAVLTLVADLSVPRGFFFTAAPVGVLGLLASRWAWRNWLTKQRRYGHYLSQAIVLGRRSDVEYVVQQIERKSGAAYHVIGVALSNGSDGPVRVEGREVPVVADLGDVADATAALQADFVIVAGDPRGGHDFVRNLAWELERTNAELVLASRLTDVAGPRIHFRPVEGLPLMHVELPNYEGARHVLKRGFDSVMAAGALFMLLPLLALIAVLVVRDSPGPALFRQERVGRDGRTFQMLKFRSMVQTAEADLALLLEQNEGAGLLFKMEHDPRVTRLGRVLRRYSLDELPQLWNVLVGDMSLVGPRPPLPREVEAYERHVHRRLFIKPGLTGMWQVNGRSNLSWEESVRLDLYYVENWSLMGDLVILWRTARVLMHPVGAY